MNKEQEFRKQTEEAKFEAFSVMCEKVNELEKENAELKEKLGDVQMQKAGEKSDLVWKLKTANEQKAEQLTEAKKVIKNLLDVAKFYNYYRDKDAVMDITPIYEAEQFLEGE